MADEFSDVIPLGEWMPDQPSLGGGANVALNVLSDGKNYKPFQSLNSASAALGEQCYGAYSHLSSTGAVTTFAATRTALKRLNNDGSWTDVSRASGGAYNTPVDGGWNFTQFGERVIATNYVDDMQSFVVGTDVKFSKLITSGPNVKARNVGVINNFLVAIDCYDDFGPIQNRVRWSPINNPAGDWTPSQSTQADYQNCEDGNPGQGMAVVGGQNYGICVFRNAIFRMEYVGPPNIFSFTLMKGQIGAMTDQAVASDGSDTFLRSENGFYRFDGANSEAIGDGKVDDFFSKDVALDYLYNLRTAADPINKTILFSYTSNNSTNGRNDKTLCYSRLDKRWTLVMAGVDMFFRAFSLGFTLEDIGALYPTIESVPYSFDSRYWQGGATVLAGVTHNGALGYFTGDPMEGVIETQEVRPNLNGQSYVDAIIPVFEGGTAQVRLGSRMNQNGDINYTPYLDQHPDTEEVNFGIEAKYHRAGIKLTGSWNKVQGVRLKILPAGGM